MLFHHTEINERMWTILIEWLIELSIEFKLNNESLHRAVAICLEYMRNTIKQIQRSRLQLIGVTSLQVACKLHEVFAPSCSDFAYICANAYTTDDIRSFEKQLLQYHILSPTPWQTIVHTSNNVRALHVANVAIISFPIISQRATDVAHACEIVSNVHKCTRLQRKAFQDSPLAKRLMNLLKQKNVSLRRKYAMRDNVIVEFPVCV